MNSSDSNPKFPTWLFIVIYVALIGAAVFFASQSPRPLSNVAVLSIVICVVLGAAVALVPLVARVERQKNEALDDCQRALEALASTVAASAEQISIAASGLHEIAELAQKNLRQAEQLPHKLQDKIAEFQAQLSAAEDAEKEEMERELLSLRTTESERLESVSQRIAKSAADWAKLEAATQQHLTAATEALAKLSLGTAAAIGKAQAAAEQALAQARVEAARNLGDAGGQAARAVEAAKVAALSDLEAKFSAATVAAVDRITRALEAKGAARESDVVAAAAPAPSPAPASPEIAPDPAEPASDASPKAEAAASTPKRPKKARREEAAVEDPAVNKEPAPAPPEPTVAAAIPPPDEPPPVPPEKFAEVAPVAPHTTEPFAAKTLNGEAAATPADTAPAGEPARPARKRTASRKPDGGAESSPGLDIDDSASQSVSVAERVITSDGATRLLVTAYIGIGNRLFIRGEGPGLNWDKGVPLQFVSIGKWRWETNDATGPVRFKLYKNDDLECAPLGAQTLDPGHQQEVTAAF